MTEHDMDGVPPELGVLSWLDGSPHHLTGSVADVERLVARVRAEERQRIAGDLARVSIHPFKGPDDTDMSMLLEAAKRIEGGYAAGGSNTRETTVRVLRFVAGMLAAGSAVPVAQCGKTNQEAGMPDFYYQDWRCGKPVGHEGHCTPYSAETAELRAAAVPVATPTGPVDEVKCPDCEATIRARMSDRPASRTDLSVRLARDTLDGGWVAEFMPMPGVQSQGETIPDALRGLADALAEAVASIVAALDGPAEQDGQR